MKFITVLSHTFTANKEKFDIMWIQRRFHVKATVFVILQRNSTSNPPCTIQKIVNDF